MFKNIVWSDKSFTLREFVDNFSLPQLVQVENGFYSEDEAKTLSAAQILTLHFTKKTDKVVAKATGTKQFFIPVNCPWKVEILPTICEDIYYSVQDIVEATSIQFIRVVHDSPPSFRLKAGDILQLKNTVEENRGKFIECEFLDETRDLVRLPLDFKAAFEPLAGTKEYHLQDVLTLFKFPVRVKFISGNMAIQDANSEVDLPSLGSVLLKEIHEESTVICTSRADDNVSVLMIPTDLEVSVLPAEGALTGDKTYARFCRKIHDGADLEKVDLSMTNPSRLCAGERDVEFLYEYVEVKPPVPPRSPGGLKPGRDGSDSCEEYIDIRPPRPPKPPKLVSPPTSPKQTTPQQPLHEESKFERQRSSDKSSAVSSWANDGAPPRPPLRTVSMQPSSSTTAYRGAYGEYCNVPADDNLPSLALEDQTPMCPAQLRDRDGYDGDDDDEDDYLYPDSFSDDGSSSSDADHDYIYPVVPVVHMESASNAPQENPDDGSKSSITKRISHLFKKTAPKTPRTTEHPLAISKASTAAKPSGKEPFRTPACNIAWSSLSTSPPTPSVANVSLDFPDDLRCLSVAEVGECLKKLKMGKYVELFESSQIDGELFVTLDGELLSSLGVNAFEQKKIMMFINGWRPK